MLIRDKEVLKRYQDNKRLWQGVPKVEVFANHVMYIAFVSGGIKDGLGNYILLYRSEDEGNNLTLIAAIQDDNFPYHDPVLWKDHANRLWLFAAKTSNFSVVSYIIDNPMDDIDSLRFSKEKYVGFEAMFHRPITLKDGTTLLATWVDNKDIVRGLRETSPLNKEGCYVFEYSAFNDDFKLIGTAHSKDGHFYSPQLFQSSKNKLSLYFRAYFGIARFISYDNGKTWIDDVNTKIDGPDSTFYIGKIDDNLTLLINYDNKNYRNNLYAYLSFDKGHTFPHRILLDARNHVSCPDVSIDKDGNIYIVYDRERGSFCKNEEHALSKAREILLAKITTKDIIAGKLVTPTSFLKKVISKLKEYDGNDFEKYGLNQDISDYVKELIDIEDNNYILKKIFMDHSGGCSTHNKEELEELNTLIDIVEKGKYCDKVEKLVIINRIVNIVSQFYGEKNKSKTADDIVSLIVDFVDEKLNEPDLGVDYIAEKFHYSRFYLTHLFKDYTGIAIKEYITNKRLSLIKELLITTNLKFHEIGHRVGILNSIYLSKWFKDNAHCSMSTYRKTHKK